MVTKTGSWFGALKQLFKHFFKIIYVIVYDFILQNIKYQSYIKYDNNKIKSCGRKPDACLISKNRKGKQTTVCEIFSSAIK